MRYNNLTIEAYSSGTTRIADPRNELNLAGSVRFATGYPGGLYLDASLIVPRSVLAWWAVNGAQRLVIRNGQSIAYEGYISDLTRALDANSQAVEIACIGGWGQIMLNRRWRKRWADTRITEDVWVTKTSDNPDMFNQDRYGNRLQATPKDGITFASNDGTSWRYTMPTGQTVKRITYDYDLQEGAQAWALGLYNVGTSTAVVEITSTGTGSTDHTLATPSQSIDLYFLSKASQTGAGDGTIYGQFTNIVVYSETGSINLTEIAKDVRGQLGELNSDETQIDSNTLALVPFLADEWRTMADILVEAVSYGDSSFDRWGVQLLASETATTPNGEPVLSVEQYPATTDWDYAVRLDEAEAPLNLRQDFNQIANWIIVEYSDANGRTQYQTPDDTAALKDQTSIDAYGQRDYVLSLGYSDSTEADNAGQRYLAAYKDPTWTVDGPIGVTGYIRSKSGQRIPASLVQAGKRVKVENFITDLVFLITRTDYEDDRERASLHVGPPPPLIFPTMAAPLNMPPAPGATGGGSSSGGNSSGGKKHPQGKWNWNQMTPEQKRWWKEHK